MFYLSQDLLSYLTLSSFLCVHLLCYLLLHSAISLSVRVDI